MRFPADKIKAAIQHPQHEIRLRAVHYFADSSHADTSIMPEVIKGLETYGRGNECYQVVAAGRDLPQTEATIAWVIGELNAEGTDQYESYAYNLSMVLLDAEPSLLLPCQGDILESRHFQANLRDSFTRRLAMASWDADTCWKALEDLCEESKHKQSINEFDHERANQIVEALARHGAGCEAKVHELLAIEIADYRHDPIKWLEPLVVRLAGRARLESTISAVVAKLLKDDGDTLNEECAESLAFIGSPAVLRALAEAYPGAPEHFRIYACAPLERIQSDLAVDVVLGLLDKEESADHRARLSQALLFQFAPEGIEIARRLLLKPDLDFTEKGLRSALLENCTLTGERFAEYDAWMATVAAERAEHFKRIKELEGDPSGLLRYALEKLMGTKMAGLARKPANPSPSFDSMQTLDVATSTRPRLAAPPKPAAKQKVGRNDPCPCGSGRKFKTCCMRR